MPIDLSPKPELVTGPTSTFVYIEKIGEFMKVARPAWEELHKVALGNLEKDKMAQMMGLSLLNPDSKIPGGTYQAGFSYKSDPSKALPGAMKVRKLEGGRYAKFLLKGPYMHLAQAYPMAMQRVVDAGLKIRPAFFMEAYLNTPEDTAEAELLTEIYIPVQ
ncbi:MAG: GyrI-like domain-containing protein [Bdellovibrionota bacterium]